MVVVNVNHKLDFKNSSPCHHCAKELKKYKIKTVYYSTSENEIVKKKLANLDFHLSSSQLNVMKLNKNDFVSIK